VVVDDAGRHVLARAVYDESIGWRINGRADCDDLSIPK
jgi:hypothetical protein